MIHKQLREIGTKMFQNMLILTVLSTTISRSFYHFSLAVQITVIGNEIKSQPRPTVMKQDRIEPSIESTLLHYIDTIYLSDIYGQ